MNLFANLSGGKLTIDNKKIKGATKADLEDIYSAFHDPDNEEKLYTKIDHEELHFLEELL